MTGEASLTIDDDTANVSTMIFKVAKHYANTDSLYLEVRHYNGVSNERFAPCLQLMQELGLDGRLYATALTNEAATLRQLHLDYSKHRQSIEFACCFVYATMVDPKVTLHTHLPAILPPPLPF
ncbi:hypothetical protein MBANPS3_000111 [Mucor bainieri]